MILRLRSHIWGGLIATRSLDTEIVGLKDIQAKK